MDRDDIARFAAGETDELPPPPPQTTSPEETKPEPEPESEVIRHDTAYSPASEAETQRKQEDRLPDSLDDDIDKDAIHVAPGTGGPDDVGDIDVDPEDLHLPGAR